MKAEANGRPRRKEGHRGAQCELSGEEKACTMGRIKSELGEHRVQKSHESVDQE